MQTRCPTCAAALRPGAPWCTLCYADLRTPVPEPDPPTPAAQDLRFDPLTAPAQELGLPGRVSAGGQASSGADAAGQDGSPTWPCTACEQPNLLSAAECTTCGTGFLAMLREGEEPLLRLPLVGDIGRFGRMQRLGLAALVVLLVILLTAILSLLTN